LCTWKIIISNLFNFFQVHFDEGCWDIALERRDLKEFAVPSIFQHVSPVRYVTAVYKKLCQYPVVKEIGDKGILAIDMLKREGKLEDPKVHQELLTFSTLLVSSALQKLRIAEKSLTVDIANEENARLTERIKGLYSILKDMEGSQ